MLTTFCSHKIQSVFPIISLNQMALLKFVSIFCMTIVMAALVANAFSVQKDTCGVGQAPLDGYFCGRGPSRRECPSTHRCVIAPNDAYAVCCPRLQERDVEIARRSSGNKPGSCPPPSGGMGICIARCSADSDCEGDQKCCGGCPRQCTKAIF